jgi:serine/threonine protein kinase
VYPYVDEKGLVQTKSSTVCGTAGKLASLVPVSRHVDHRFVHEYIIMKHINPFYPSDYMSPEMILRHGHSMAVDCWAYGVLLCELLSGYAPFTACRVYLNNIASQIGGRKTSATTSMNTVRSASSSTATTSMIAENYVRTKPVYYLSITDDLFFFLFHSRSPSINGHDYLLIHDLCFYI